MEDHFKITSVAGFGGIVLALVAWPCSFIHALQPEHTLLWGWPIAPMGMIGYALIGATALLYRYKLMRMLNYGLILGAAGFTVFLVYRSIQVELACPGCLACWALTGFILFKTTYYVLPKTI